MVRSWYLNEMDPSGDKKRGPKVQDPQKSSKMGGKELVFPRSQEVRNPGLVPSHSKKIGRK